MSNYSVVSDVGTTLKKLLLDKVLSDNELPDDLIGEDDIAISSPKESQSDEQKKISLFLYQITQDPYLKNAEPVLTNTDTIKRAPLYLNLFYLITAKTGDEIKDHLLIGKIMQVLYDNSIIRGSVLQGALVGEKNEISVNLLHVPLEELINLWQGFTENTYRLSVCYQVSNVCIDSSIETEIKRVIKKKIEYY